MEPTNQDRAERGRRALEAWNQGEDLLQEDMQTVIVDVIADLLHLAFEEGVTTGTPAGGIVQMAKDHYDSEIEEEYGASPSDE